MSRNVFTQEQRDEIARILEIVAKDGLDGPRDLDVALDAIECTITDRIKGGDSE